MHILSLIYRNCLKASLALLFFFSASLTVAGEQDQPAKIYVDPVTGEVVEYQKLPSEMTPEEKANLTLQEVKKLEEIEAAQKAKEKVREPGL